MIAFFKRVWLRWTETRDNLIKYAKDTHECQRETEAMVQRRNLVDRGWR